MKKCEKCALPEQFPNSRIDETGICIFCRKKKIIENYSHELTRFNKILAEPKNGKYDAVVCYSGGKDSTYTLIQAKKKFSLNPLAFTLDNGFISSKAKENIENICEKLGVDLITIKPNAKQMNAIFKGVIQKKIFSEVAMFRLSAVCYSCINYVIHTAISLAQEKDIRFILSGFTHGQVPKAVFPYFPEVIQKTYYDFQETLSASVGFNVKDFYPQIDFNLMKERVIYNINPLLFERYDEKKIICEIKKFGWERPQDSDSCSSNCRINKVGNYFHNKMYGYHPYQYEISTLIRSGSITKEEGEKLLGDIKLDNDVSDIIKKLEIENLC